MRSSSRALLTVPAGGSEPPGFPADPCRDPVTLQSTADYGATGAHLLHVTCVTLRYPRNVGAAEYVNKFKKKHPL